MMKGMKGRLIVQVNIFATCLFLITSLAAAILFREPFKTIAVSVDLLCFSLGVVVFLWGYWTAVQRSRQDNISVAALYFLIDKISTRQVTYIMNSLLGVQFVGGIVTALMRGSTDGKRGSTLAFGILVPMLGLGLNGLWAAYHGTFSARSDIPPEEMPPSSTSSGKD